MNISGNLGLYGRQVGVGKGLDGQLLTGMGDTFTLYTFIFLKFLCHVNVLSVQKLHNGITVLWKLIKNASLWVRTQGTESAFLASSPTIDFDVSGEGNVLKKKKKHWPKHFCKTGRMAKKMPACSVTKGLPMPFSTKRPHLTVKF